MNSLANNPSSKTRKKIFKTIYSSLLLGIIFITLYSCQRQKTANSPNSSDHETYVAYLQDTTVIILSDSTSTPVQIRDDTDQQVMNPAVSPDGRQLAYTQIINSNDSRTIYLMNLATLKSNQLAVPSSNFYGPVCN